MTPEEFGERIRAHREAKGLGIEELASRFKLSLSAVRAMERGSLHDLPHAVYAKGFIRAYAQAVDVPPEELAEGLAVLFPEETLSEPSAAPLYTGGFPNTPIIGQSKSFAEIFVVLIVLALLGLGGWFAYSHLDSVKSFVLQPFSALNQSSENEGGDGPDGATSVDPASESAPAPGSPAVGGIPAEAPLRTQSQNVQDLPATPLAGGGTATPLESAVEAAAPVPDVPISGNHVVVQAVEECWVQVSADGEASRTFTVYPGENSVLPYKRRLTLVLGNSGGAALVHNGQAYPFSGKKNEKRTFTFQ